MFFDIAPLSNSGPAIKLGRARWRNSGDRAESRESPDPILVAGTGWLRGEASTKDVGSSPVVRAGTATIGTLPAG